MTTTQQTYSVQLHDARDYIRQHLDTIWRPIINSRPDHGYDLRIELETMYQTAKLEPIMNFDQFQTLDQTSTGADWFEKMTLRTANRIVGLN